VTAARELTEALDGRVRDGAPLGAVLADEASTLNEVVPHDGLVIAMDGAVSQIACHFAAPPPFSELIAWVDHRVLVSDSFGRMISLSRSEREAAAGGAFLALSEDGNEWVTLVRRNYPRVVNWGGGKESEGQVDDAGVLHLSPRRSFALWQERVDGQCIPFTADEREALTLLQRTLSSLRATERERAARQAQQAAERREADLRFELMQTARLTSMTELASAVAHELNQPLTAVMNYITASRELLRPYEAAVPPDVVALIEDGFEQAERAAQIVRRLRAFIARGELERSPIDLPATITEAARLALPTRASDDLEVRYDFARQLPSVPADRVQIQQVVFNLVRNALEAMGQQSERCLQLGARPIGDDMVEAWVRDTGPGIAPEMMDDLFRPLVSRKRGGMGIGLSLCRSIIEAHGGCIEAQNTAKGAEVRFRLPIAPIGS
jgi:signal transduction histidine kinase